MNLITLIRLFIKANGRRPTPNELSELQKKAMAPRSAEIIKFPEGGRDRVPVNEQFGGIGSLESFKEAEDSYEELRKAIQRQKENQKELQDFVAKNKYGSTKLRGDETFDELIDTGIDEAAVDFVRRTDGEEAAQVFKKRMMADEESVGLVESIKAGLSTEIKLNSARENRKYAKDLIGGKSEEFNTLKAEDRKEILDLIEDRIFMDESEIPFAKGGLANVLGV